MDSIHTEAPWALCDLPTAENPDPESSASKQPPNPEFALSSVTKNHQLSDLINRNVSSHSSSGGSLRARCWQDCFLLKVMQENLLHPFPGFWNFVANLWHCLACRSIALISASIFLWHSPCVYICVQISPSSEDKSYWIKGRPYFSITSS